MSALYDPYRLHRCTFQFRSCGYPDSGGAVALVASAVVIYFRGYLVPGTLMLTRRHLPAGAEALFGKDDTLTGARAQFDVLEENEVEVILRSAGVVEPAPADGGLRLTDEFCAEWRHRIRRFREDGGALAHPGTVVDVDPAQLAFEDDDAQLVITYDGDPVGGWLSEAAFYADLAVESTLDEWMDDWDQLETAGVRN